MDLRDIAIWRNWLTQLPLKQKIAGSNPAMATIDFMQ